MNKTRIDWADYTWNPVVGCSNGCSYCYAKRIFERFNPGQKFKDLHIYEDRIQEPLQVKKPARIFVGSMTDLMSDMIPESFIKKILQTMRQASHHTFIMMTKDNRAYIKYAGLYPENCWQGITITGDEPEDIQDIRVENLTKFWRGIKVLNFEPLMGRVSHTIGAQINWIIIGGLTGPGVVRNEPRIKTEVQEILQRARNYGIPVFIKENLKWPEEIKNYPISLDKNIERWDN